jgi:NAD(P) transhydrogenase subunit alpha
MSAELVAQITVLVLAAFVGFEVISKVPTMLHTPLMSATNAIHGVVLIGALIVLAHDPTDTYVRVLGFVAVVFGTMNVVGGFVVTDRMLEMFKPRPLEINTGGLGEEPASDAGDADGGAA